MSCPAQRRGGSGGRIERLGLVVESQGETVVRFIGTCSLAPAGQGGPCPAGCAVFQQPRQIPLRRLGRSLTLRQGDAVVLSLSERALTGLAWRIFGAPLMALLGGAWLGSLLAEPCGVPEDLAAAVAGLSCLTVTLLHSIGHGNARRWEARLQLSARRSGMDS